MDKHHEELHRHRMEELAILRDSAHLAETNLGLQRELVRAANRREDEISALTQEIVNLGALFEWKLDQVLEQFDRQTAQLDRVIDLLRRPLETQARELWDRAQYAATRGWIEEAVTFYDRAIEKSPFLYLAHLQLGYLHAYRRGDVQAALSSFRAAAKYSQPDDPVTAAVAHFHLHGILRATGHKDEAWKAIVRACDLDPSLAPAWWDRATLAVERSVPDEVTKSLRRAIESDPLYWHRSDDQGEWGQFADRVRAMREEMLHSAVEKHQSALSAFDTYLARARSALDNLPLVDQPSLNGTIKAYEAKCADIRRNVQPSIYAHLVITPRAVKSAMERARTEFVGTITHLIQRTNDEKNQISNINVGQSDLKRKRNVMDMIAIGIAAFGVIAVLVWVVGSGISGVRNGEELWLVLISSIFGLIIMGPIVVGIVLAGPFFLFRYLGDKADERMRYELRSRLLAENDSLHTKLESALAMLRWEPTLA